MRSKYYLILLGNQSISSEKGASDWIRETVISLVSHLQQADEQSALNTPSRTSVNAKSNQLYHESNLFEDSLVSLLCEDSKTFIATVRSRCHHEFQGLETEAEWTPLTHGLDLLTTLPRDGHHNKHHSREGVADESHTEMAAQMHRLADNMQQKGGRFVVNIFWILPSCDNFILRENLSLLGALKRFQQWNFANISIVTLSSSQKQSSYFQSWEKILDFDILCPDAIPTKVANLLDTVWQGDVSFLEAKSKSSVCIPGFSFLRDCNRNIVHTSPKVSIIHDRNIEHMPSSDSRIILPEIHVLGLVDRNSVPPFMLLPLKLKLHVTSSSKRSSDFMYQLKNLSTQGLCFKACISMMSRSSEDDLSTVAWISHVKSGATSQKTSPHFQGAVERRLCLITCPDQGGQPDVFISRRADVFDGLIYERLSLYSHKINDLGKEESLNLPNITEEVLSNEEDISRSQNDDLLRALGESNDGQRKPTVSYGDILKLVNDVRRRKNITHSSRNETLCLDLVSSAHTLHTNEIQNPSEEWPEKLWLIQNDPVELAAREVKTKPDVRIHQVLSLDMKEALKMFRPDGRPARDDLSPLKPPVKRKRRAVNHIIINTTEADIRETNYPQALDLKFHGVEYCLDSHDSLVRDQELASTQISVVTEETLSTCAGPRSKGLESKRRSKRGNAESKTSNAAGGRDPETRATRTRSSKRLPSEDEKPCNQQAKKKRKQSPANATRSELREQTTKITKEPREKTAKEKRSDRHKRRLRQVVEATLDDFGMAKDNGLFASCSERLYSLTKSFLKDLKTSHGLNDEMKRLARSNVQQVIEFEQSRKTTARQKNAPSNR